MNIAKNAVWYLLKVLFFITSAYVVKKHYGLKVLMYFNMRDLLVDIYKKENKKMKSQDIDYLATSVAATICVVRYPDILISFYDKNRKKINDQVKKVVKKEPIKKIYIELCLSNHYYISLYNKIEAEKYYNNAKKLYKGAKQYTDKEISLLFKRLKQNQKERVRKIDEKALDDFDFIQINLKDITYFIGIATTACLISGYLYSKIYLDNFGIETSFFFSTSDYLSVSVDKVYLSLISVLITAAFFLFHINMSLQLSEREKYFLANKSKKKERADDLDHLIMVSVIAVLAVIASINNFTGKYYIIAILMYIVGMHYSSKLSIKFMKNMPSSPIIIFFITIFSINMFATIMTDIDKTKAGKQRSIQYSFSLRNKTKYSLKGYNLISANSRYYFFYHHKKRQSVVLPSEQVLYIKTKKDI